MSKKVIYLDDAIDAVGSMLRRKFGIGSDLAEITLAGLPPAQPEVVRCKDCKYNGECSIQFAAYADDKFFCGAGERRQDG